MDGPAARKFPSAQQEVNAVRESGAVTPPARWHRYASSRCEGCAGLPGAEPACLRHKGQSQRASGAELCESLLKRSLWWISFTASWNSSLSWEAHVWRTFKHKKRKTKKNNKTASNSRNTERKETEGRAGSSSDVRNASATISLPQMRQRL